MPITVQINGHCRLHRILFATVMTYKNSNAVNQLMLVMINLALVYSMDSVATASLYKAVKAYDFYIIPKAMAPNVGPSFNSSVMKCAYTCNAMHGDGEVSCLAFIYASTSWGQPATGTGNCQPVTYGNASDVVLKFDKTGVQRFFADPVQFAHATGMLDLVNKIIFKQIYKT